MSVPPPTKLMRSGAREMITATAYKSRGSASMSRSLYKRLQHHIPHHSKKVERAHEIEGIAPSYEVSKRSVMRPSSRPKAKQLIERPVVTLGLVVVVPEDE